MTAYCWPEISEKRCHRIYPKRANKPSRQSQNRMRLTSFLAHERTFFCRMVWQILNAARANKSCQLVQETSVRYACSDISHTFVDTATLASPIERSRLIRCSYIVWILVLSWKADYLPLPPRFFSCKVLRLGLWLCLSLVLGRAFFCFWMLLKQAPETRAPRIHLRNA